MSGMGERYEMGEMYERVEMNKRVEMDERVEVHEMSEMRENGEMREMRRKIILASASPRRLELLGQVGIVPVVEPSQVEEVITSTAPEEVVMELSRQKALDVAGKHAGEAAVVIGADTVVAVDGTILGKPRDREDAIRMIGMLQGRSHQVYTGVTVVFGDGTGRQEPGADRAVTFYEKTEVHVYPMTQEEIASYVYTGEPMDKAGGYGIQGQFAAWIQGICGDYSSVVGLPVGRVCQVLREER